MQTAVTMLRFAPNLYEITGRVYVSLQLYFPVDVNVVRLLKRTSRFEEVWRLVNQSCYRPGQAQRVPGS